MKKATLVFPIIIVMICNITGLTVEAASKKNTQNCDIQLEKLANTETAKELNAYRDTLLSYLNNIIKQKNKIGVLNNMKSLKKSDIDFNNEKKVYGIKNYNSYTNYTLNADYDDTLKELSDTGYEWHILIKSSSPQIYLIISPCNMDENDKFCFGGKWKVDFCSINSNPDSVNNYAMYESAEKNISKFINSEKNDEIKVLFTSFGDRSSTFHSYLSGGIVFVNGNAKYIYTFGFQIFPDNLIDGTPDNVRSFLVNGVNELYNNRQHSIGSCKDIKMLYDFNYVAALILIYECYSLDQS